MNESFLKPNIEKSDLLSIEKQNTFEQSITHSVDEFNSTVEDTKNIESSLANTDIPEKEKSVIKESLDKIKNASKNVSKFIFYRVLPAYIAYFSIAEMREKSDGKFSEKERAKVEMAKDGITSEQKSAYRLGTSEALYRGIVPWGYQNSESSDIPNIDAIKYFPGRVILGREVASNNPDYAISPAREDAWRLMLGLRQENNTFGISDYKPENSSDDKFYFKINGFEEKIFSNHFLENKDWEALGDMQKGWIKSDRSADSKLDSLEFDNLKYGIPLSSSVLEFVNLVKSNGGTITHSDIEGDMTIGLMGHFKISCGQDEKGSYVSYYDTWDLDNTFLELGKHLTKSYEIYDRIYYNPQTGEIQKDLLSK